MKSSSAGNTLVPDESGRRGRELEVVTLLEVCDQPGLRWLPAEAGARERARGGRVGPDERAEEAEVLGRVLSRDRHDWHLEVPADDLPDVANRHSPPPDPVRHRARRRPPH